MKQKKRIKIDDARILTPSEMKAEAVSKFWPLDKTCGVSGICPDGHRISCQATYSSDEGSGVCKHIYLSFGESGNETSDTLVGVSCGNTTINCSDKPSSPMPSKVKACLDKREWDTCSFLSDSGTDKGGYCRYGDPAAPSDYKNYLYCSDLGVLSGIKED